jgi:hypothetical protein
VPRASGNKIVFAETSKHVIDRGERPGLDGSLEPLRTITPKP